MNHWLGLAGNYTNWQIFRVGFHVAEMAVDIRWITRWHEPSHIQIFPDDPRYFTAISAAFLLHMCMAHSFQLP